MSYSETRSHELRKRSLLMVDGNLLTNLQSAQAGTSARVQQGGYWGFASASESGEAVTARLADQARRNAARMARFGRRDELPLPTGSYQGRHAYAGRPAIALNEAVQQLAELTAFCRKRYPDVKTVRIRAEDEHHTKHIGNSLGADATNSIQRTLCHVTLMALGADGSPVEITERSSGKGSLADIALDPAGWEQRLDALHGHLRAKCEAVPARGGIQQVVLASDLAGMLAHEAMGHPCEADVVLAGAITGQLRGQRVASDLVTMVDFAHTYEGQETLIPVYADDEGTPGQDAVLIRNGILTDFMSSRETAARLGIAATGNARAYEPSDEPLVRMRNTAILPGTSRLDDLLAGVDDGYYLMKTGNGQADSTTEFMFGITLAYEIKNGRLGRAIKDTTVSGSAIKVLQAVDGVSSEMAWDSGGYCGKKQFMVVSAGGPALRTRLHVGGEA